jgi:oligoribonuclease (3'-5' exoribonuclease)
MKCTIETQIWKMVIHGVLKIENVTDRNISILAENHGYLVKKFNEAVEAAHNNHVNTVQTSYLIEHVANLENRMQAVEKNMTL